MPTTEGHDPYQSSLDDFFGDKWAKGPAYGGGGGGGTEPPVDPGVDPALIQVIMSVLGGSSFGEGGGMPPRRRMQSMGVQERVPIPAYAYGTSYHRGGPAVVGEQGPEMVNLPRGASVTPNPATSRPMLGGMRRIMGPGGSGAPPPPGTIPGTDGWTERQGMRDSDVPLGGLIGPSGYSMPQFLQQLVASMTRGGALDPLGSKALAGMARDSVSSSMGARERAGQLGADLDSGGDPALRAYARTNARLNTQSEASKAYLDAILRSAFQNQSFLQQLFGGPITGAATRQDPKSNPWAQAAGQLGGAALGSFLGPAGTAIGAGIGGAAGGSQQMYPQDQWSW